MIVKRDFTFNKDALISYYKNLKQFIGIQKTQTYLARFFNEKYPDDHHYNSLDRKFATLKFYGFVYFNDDKELMFNEHFEEYIDNLKKNIEDPSCFLKILRSSKDR